MQGIDSEFKDKINREGKILYERKNKAKNS